VSWPTCKQKDCKEIATFRYTWPGRPESHICVEHAVKLKATADAIGLPIFLYPAQDLGESETP
jgi:hypothetical protein